MRTPNRPLRRLTAAILTGCAVGCSLVGPAPGGHPAPADDHVVECRALFERVDDAVTAAGVQDAQSARIRGLPYLRLNRFLARGVPVAREGPPFQAWVDRLRRLDRQARAAELANLPAKAERTAWPGALEGCAAVLRAHDLDQPETRRTLLTATVPDDYRLIHRVLGLYPLTSVPFLMGVRDLHRETAHTFAQPLDALPVHGALRRFGPERTATLEPAAVAALLQAAADNALNVPEPDPATLQRLLAAFAPVWEVDVAADADRPGSARLERRRHAVVDGSPMVYTLTSHARWQGRSLLQLNYVLWFPARPRQGTFDLLGGHLDGLTLRVTLGADGRPLLYETMHNCGCYYKAYVTPRIELTTPRRGWQEPVSVPQQLADGPGRVVLRVSATSHYVQRLYRDDGSVDQAYRFADYDTLRSLPLPQGGHASLFGPDGIVPGTQRRERWLFWPMGVPEPGAMRQWGNHAIAFVGRRHFDDPELLERHFGARGRDAP